jgi:hypothetical protein
VIGDKDFDFDYIPSCKSDFRYVTVLLGQERSNAVADMQGALDSITPVGCIGAALGCLSKAYVSESIGWVQNFDLRSCISNIELGFGNAVNENSKNVLKDSTPYESLSTQQLNKLDDKGYVFLMKYAGLEGHAYFSSDQTCSDADYRTIARNRTINKSRRAVRSVLLPYVNSPIKVDPTTGFLSAGQNTVFSNLVKDVLQAMTTLGEISGFSVNIPANQNVLQSDTLIINYTIIPIGTAKHIKVTEGLALKQ